MKIRRLQRRATPTKIESASSRLWQKEEKPTASHYFKCHLPRYIWAVTADKIMEKEKQPAAFCALKTSLIQFSCSWLLDCSFAFIFAATTVGRLSIWCFVFAYKRLTLCATFIWIRTKMFFMKKCACSMQIVQMECCYGLRWFQEKIIQIKSFLWNTSTHHSLVIVVLLQI